MSQVEGRDLRISRARSSSWCTHPITTKLHSTSLARPDLGIQSRPQKLQVLKSFTVCLKKCFCTSFARKCTFGNMPFSFLESIDSSRGRDSLATRYATNSEVKKNDTVAVGSSVLTFADQRPWCSSKCVHGMNMNSLQSVLQCKKRWLQMPVVRIPAVHG